MIQPAESQELQLQNLLLVLWRRKVLIFLTTVLALGAAYLFAEEPPTPTPVFRATATMVMDLGSGRASSFLAGALPDALGDRGLQTQIRLMRSKNVMDRAAAKVLGDESDLSPGEIAIESAVLQSGVSISPVQDTNLLEVRVNGSSPSLAERRADAIIDAYIDYVKAAQTQAIEEALESARNTISTSDGAQPSALASALLLRLAPELESVSVAVNVASKELRVIEQTQPEPERLRPNANALESIASQFRGAAAELSVVFVQLTSIQTRFIAQAAVPLNTATADTAALLGSMASSAASAATRLSEGADLLTSSSPTGVDAMQSIDSIALNTWLRLDSLTREIGGVGARVSDLTLSSEIATLIGLVSTNRNSIQSTRGPIASILKSLPDDPNGGADTDETPAHLAGLIRAQQLLRSVALSIQQTLTLTSVDERGEVEPVRFSELENSAAHLGASNRILGDAGRAAESLRETASGVDESTQLLVIVERIQNATARLSTIVGQLIQGASRPDGIDRQELLRLEQDLELALLRPQETGLAIVDSAEARRVNDPISASSFGFDLRVMAAGAAGLLVGIIGALTMEFTDRRVRTAERLRSVTGLSSMGQIPRVARAPGAPLPMPDNGHPSVFDVAMRLVADQVLSTAPAGHKAMLITSPLRGEGKTTIAMNIARLSARAGFQTLLIDADLRKQDAGTRLGVTTSVGLTTILQGRVEPGSHTTRLETDLDFLPGGDATSVEPMTLLSSPAMNHLVEWATGRYDKVFIDCPPLVGHADTILMTRHVGDVLMVLDSRHTRLGDVQRAKDATQDVGANIVGCVVNFVPAKSIGLANASHGNVARRWWKLPKAPMRNRWRKRPRPDASLAEPVSVGATKKVETGSSSSAAGEAQGNANKRRARNGDTNGNDLGNGHH